MVGVDVKAGDAVLDGLQRAAVTRRVTDRVKPATRDRVIPAKLRKDALSSTFQRSFAERGNRWQRNSVWARLVRF